ncbi:MAG: amidohydrolase [Firmicutes bacterium]|nr:amidohydrolase [Bacillota bacterium]MBQ4233994.1 amidohydrolase [Bacillota bacterium]MBQ6013025.1 amidohydrolase [Bacillota bacterium]MBR0113996.1 amidohydrolase [Bacillota bacterium]MBR0441718.1 amidohydrolase [Bacillota bacterium]
MLVIKNGKVVTVTGETINNGVVAVDKGKIVFVGKEFDAPSDAKVINARGKYVTPGLIDAHTHISNFADMTDRNSQIDGNEMSDPITPQVRAIDAVYPFENGIKLARAAGFTTVCILPGSANLIGGIGQTFKLKKAQFVEDMVMPGTEVMKFALGENPRRVYGSNGKMPMTRMGNAALMRNALYDAKVYSDALLAAEKDPSKAPKPNFKLDALVPVVRGEMKCRMHAHRADDIATHVRIAEEFGLKYSIEHCTEGWMILDFLKEHNVTAVVGPLTMSRAKFEIWNRRLDTPAQMEKAGINFMLTADTNGDTQYLPVHVGMCMGVGLSEQAAFEAVTIRPARWLGVADRVGSIEVGKDADLAIFTGHPFSNFSRCQYTVIDGEVYQNF